MENGTEYPVTADDKKILKKYALEYDTTVAALIEEYVEKLREGLVRNE